MKFNPYSHRYSIIGKLMLFYLSLGFFTRCLLWISTPQSHIRLTQVPGIFIIGLLYDVVIGGLILIPIVLLLWFENEWIYHKKRWIFVAIGMILLFGLAIYLKWLPKEFNGALYNALLAYISFRIIVFIGLALAGVKKRMNWRITVLYLVTELTLFLMMFNMVSEYFFWQEFSSRYNFIAVDYLVYTTEVLGNIKESYPVPWIIAGCLLVAVVVGFSFRKQVFRSATDQQPFLQRTGWLIVLVGVPMLMVSVLKSSTRKFSSNEYANELAGNGVFQFGYAFTHNQLDYQTFYQTIPEKEAFKTVRSRIIPGEISNGNELDLKRDIIAEGYPNKYNVVLISVESFSASFMKAFGNTDNITPRLDSLAPASWFFTNLYATGTRTVRGLEALSMSIPPTPGQSIVKRPDNVGLFTIGSVLRSHGYTTQFLYGGYSYFDNMKQYFSSNGYDVIDRTAIPEHEIHYQNIWGVADEDLFTLALKTFDENSKKNKPFFSQIMTVSNHRPFTYPDGRIDIPSKSQSRNGAVKYTDYAIGDFLQRAASHSWFDHTIFIIIADHCAGAAGSVDLPVTGYHIPMLIYAPKIISPRVDHTLISQIDVAPTIMGLLNISYQSKFFGEDIRKADTSTRRVFISTYQGLGYLTADTLAILSPVKKIEFFKPDFTTGDAKRVQANSRIRTEAISFYEAASSVLKRGKQKFDQ